MGVYLKRRGIRFIIPTSPTDPFGPFTLAIFVNFSIAHRACIEYHGEKSIDDFSILIVKDFQSFAKKIVKPI
jgi:hypothetical protein